MHMRPCAFPFWVYLQLYKIIQKVHTKPFITGNLPLPTQIEQFWQNLEKKMQKNYY